MMNGWMLLGFFFFWKTARKLFLHFSPNASLKCWKVSSAMATPRLFLCGQSSKRTSFCEELTKLFFFLECLCVACERLIFVDSDLPDISSNWEIEGCGWVAFQAEHWLFYLTVHIQPWKAFKAVQAICLNPSTLWMEFSACLRRVGICQKCDSGIEIKVSA